MFDKRRLRWGAETAVRGGIIATRGAGAREHAARDVDSASYMNTASERTGVRWRVPKPCRAVIALACAAAGLAGQVKVRVVPPVESPNVIFDEPGAGQDPGPPVHLVQSPNLDRFLHKARSFLERDDYGGAITVLQHVLEGRVTRDADSVGEVVAGEPAPAPPDEEDPAKAVFSSDGRLYRPVRRLCHELLASLPAPAIELYQARFEVEAAREVDAAIAARDLAALERVYHRYFVTRAAGRAMDTAADLLMDQGRFRTAILTVRTLLELYPAALRAGDPDLSDLALGLKLAVCLQFGGDARRVRETLTGLAERFPGQTVQVQGEAMAVADLAASRWFMPPAQAQDEPPAGSVSAPPALDTLVPLWEARFDEPRPYAKPSTGTVSRVFGEAGGPLVAPEPNFGAPGTSVVAAGGTAVFMNHNQLRVHDARSGRVRGLGDGKPEMYRLEPHRMPPRIAAYDRAAMRVAADAERFYAILVPEVKLPQGWPVLVNRMCAYDKTTFARIWTIGQGGDHPECEGLTFLSTPTVVGDRLLVPVQQRGTSGILCVAAATGQPLFRTFVHSGGTAYARAPGTHVAVDRDAAFLLTNAGVLASIDLHSGDINWVRRYERRHPFREHKTQRRTRAQHFGDASVTTFENPDGFAPSDLVVHGGKVVFAPVDAQVLTAVDGSTGEVEWMLSLRKPEMEYLLGASDGQLFIAGKSILCVDIRTGIRLWADTAPEHRMGRGALVDGLILLPGTRRIHLLSVERRGPWRSIDLPPLLKGQEPQAGAFNLTLSGPYLFAAYTGGVEAYAALGALETLARSAADPLERAAYFAHAGSLMAAIDELTGALHEQGLVPDARARAEAELLRLLRDVATAAALLDQRQVALGLLDRCRPLFSDTKLVDRWHLIRIEVLRALRDAPAAQRELWDLERRLGSGSR
jgi:hypothetical protein